MVRVNLIQLYRMTFVDVCSNSLITWFKESTHGGDFSRQKRSYSKTRLFANLANIVIMRDQWEEKHGGFEESESSSKYLR